jgi:3'(2'), 5'-bisphosphate nucleotidase
LHFIIYDKHMNSFVPSSMLEILNALARNAGALIMEIYGTDFSSHQKSDSSPVTEADEKAEALILKGLASHFPNIPVIAEEAVAAGQIPKIGNEFFLVDPLDGTKEFISRNGEFTVNIALIKNHFPVAGVVYAPALKRLYCGEHGVGAACSQIGSQLQPINVRKLPEHGATVLASRSHRDQATNDYLANIKVAELFAAGSSLKFCTIAEGKADIYPRFGRTMEWDTGAGHAVLAAAGGKVIEATGKPLLYGKSDRGFDNPAFIASAS